MQGGDKLDKPTKTARTAYQDAYQRIRFFFVSLVPNRTQNVFDAVKREQGTDQMAAVPNARLPACPITQPFAEKRASRTFTGRSLADWCGGDRDPVFGRQTSPPSLPKGRRGVG